MFIKRHHDFLINNLNNKIFFKWHITSKKDFYKILNTVNFKRSDNIEYQISIIVNSIEDIDLIEDVIKYINKLKIDIFTINFEFSHGRINYCKNSRWKNV